MLCYNFVIKFYLIGLKECKTNFIYIFSFYLKKFALHFLLKLFLIV